MMCIYFVCVEEGHVRRPTCIEVIGQLTTVGSLLPPCHSWGSNSGCQAWLQMPLPAEHHSGPEQLILCGSSVQGVSV